MSGPPGAQPGAASHQPALRGVPELPPHYLERRDIIAELAARLRGQAGKVAITAAGAQPATSRQALHGMGGLGKTVLANAVARAVAGNFEHGVIWVTVGQEPRMDVLHADMARALGFAGAAASHGQLKQWLADREILLVLDDVWSVEHLHALDVVGERGRLLVTTRDRRVLIGDIELHSLDVLAPEQALALLAGWTRTETAHLCANADAVRIAEACGYLPLALAMIGAMVSADVVSWPDALALLEAADLVEIEQRFPNYPYPDLLRAMEVSVRALPADLAGLYADLAVFPEDVWVPDAAVQIVWGLPGPKARKRIGDLAARSLLTRDNAGRIQLHDVQRMYVQGRATSLPALHARLVHAYAEACQGRGFAAGPNDGYFFQRLPYHYAGASLMDELAALLLDYAWLDAKLRATSPTELVDDFAYVDPENAAYREAMLVRDAARLASHVLAADPGHLSSQLVGRLLGFEYEHERIDRLLAQVRADTQRTWICPLTPTLTQAGSPLVRTFVGHTNSVTAVAELPDGERALSASEDNTLKLWHLNSGAVLRTFQGHSKTVTAIAVLPGGNLALSASSDNTLKLWSLDSGTILRTLEGHLDWVTAIAVLPNGNLVLSASKDNTLKLWNLDSGTALRTFQGHSKMVTAVAVLPDGRRALSASKDKRLKLWDLDSGAVLRTFRGHSKMVTAVAVLPGGKRALSASRDGTLKLWDLDSGAILDTLRDHSWEAAVAVLPGGRRALSASRDSKLKLWDLHSGAVLRTFRGHSKRVRAVAVLPDSKLALSASRDNTLKLWDLHSATVQRTFQGHSKRVRAVAVLPDGKLALSASEDRTLKLWDLNSGTVLRTFQDHLRSVRAVAVLPDGKLALSASEDRTLKLWDLDSGTVLRTLQGHSAWIRAVAVVPGSKLALSASEDNTLKLWDLGSGALLRTLTDHSGVVTTVAVVPNRSLALAGGRDKALKLWDLTTGALMRTLPGHLQVVRGVAIELDGKLAVSASRDNTLKLWDLHAGQVIATFVGEYPMETCAFTPNTRIIVAGDNGGNVHMLRLIEAAGAAEGSKSARPAL